MREVRVTAISIDDAGRLLLRPELGPGETFEFIYRAARAVHWDTAAQALCTAAPVTGSYRARFASVLAAAASEYGCRLVLAPEITWDRVPADIRDGIVQEAARETPP